MNGLLQAPTARRNRLLLVTGAVVLLLVLLFLARRALFPFILGLILAYLFLPVVRRIEAVLPGSDEQRERARLLAVLAVYLFALALIALVAAFLFPLVFRQLSRFFTLLPSMVAQAQEVLNSWTAEYRANVPPEVQLRVEEALAHIAQSLAGAAQDAALRTFAVVSQTFSVLLGLFTVPVWLFYVLKDRQHARDWASQLLPSSVRDDAIAIVGIVDRVLASYLRAQLLLGVLVGIMTGTGLALMGVQFALVLGIIAGITELIPILGPTLGAIPAVLVTLANAPQQVIWVVLLFIGVQAVENNLLVPRIQGHAVAIHPALIMMLLVLASEVAGLWGMLVAVPLAAVCREVFLHLYRRFSAEEPAYTS